MTRRSKRARKQRDFYEPGSGEPNGEQMLNRKRVSLKKFGREEVESEEDGYASAEDFQPKKAKTSTKKPASKRARQKADHSELFKALSAKNIAVLQVAREWLNRFRKNQGKATNEIINFVLECAGCEKNGIISLGEGESMDMEGVLTDLAEDVANKYEHKREVDNYAVNAKAKSEWGHLNKNFRSFWHKVVEYGRREILLGAQTLTSLLDTLEVMKSIKLKSFRHTSAVAALSIGHAIIEVCQEQRDSLQKAIRQFKAEEKKSLLKLKGASKQKYVAGMKEFNTFYDSFTKEISAEVSKGRDKNPLLAKASTMQAKVEKSCISLLPTRASALWDGWMGSLSDLIAMEKLTVRIFVSMLTICIKDKERNIREEVVEDVGEWIREYPSLFLNERYLKYIGQSLSDKEPSVRKCAVSALGSCLVEADDSLQRFVDRFKGRIVEMVDDPKAVVSACALQSLTSLASIGALDEQDVHHAESVLFFEDNSKYVVLAGHGQADKDFSIARVEAARFVLSSSVVYKDWDEDEEDSEKMLVKYVEGILKLLETHVATEADVGIIYNNPVASQAFRGCVAAFCEVASFATDWKAIATCLRQHRNRKRAVVAVQFLSHAAEVAQDPALTDFLQENLADLVVRFQADHMVLHSLVNLVKFMEVENCTSSVKKAKTEKLTSALMQAFVQHGDQALLSSLARTITLDLCEQEHVVSRMAQTELKTLKQEVVKSVQAELQARGDSENDMNMFVAVRRVASLLSFSGDFDESLLPLLSQLRGEIMKRIQSTPDEVGLCAQFVEDGLKVCFLHLMWQVKFSKVDEAAKNVEGSEDHAQENSLAESVGQLVQERDDFVNLLEAAFSRGTSEEDEYSPLLIKSGVAFYQRLQSLFSMKYEFGTGSGLDKLGWNPSHQLQAKIARTVHVNMEVLNEDLAEEEEEALELERVEERLAKRFHGGLKTLQTIWDSLNPSMQSELLGTNVYDKVTERISASLLQYTNDNSEIIAEEVQEFLLHVKENDVERAATLALVTLQLAFQSMIRMEDEEEREERLERILQTGVTLSKQLVPNARKSKKETIIAMECCIGVGMQYAMSDLPEKTQFLTVITPLVKVLGRSNRKSLQEKWKQVICSLPKASQDALFATKSSRMNLACVKAIADFERVIGAVTKNSSGVKLSDMVRKFEDEEASRSQAKPLELVSKRTNSPTSSDNKSETTEDCESDGGKDDSKAQKSFQKSVFDDDSSVEDGLSATGKRKRSSKMESDDLFKDRIDKESPEKSSKRAKASVSESEAREEEESDGGGGTQQITGFLPSRRSRRKKK